jgi:hypothetical protein
MRVKFRAWWLVSAGIVLVPACGASFSGDAAKRDAGGAGGSLVPTGGAGSGGKANTGGEIEAGVSGSSGAMNPGASGAPSQGGTMSGSSGGDGGQAGAGMGAAGAPVNVDCDELIPEKAQWTATANHDGEDLACAHASNPQSGIDGNLATPYTSGEAQHGDEWFEVDFNQLVTFNTIVLDSLGEGDCSAPYDYPSSYAVRVSDTPGDLESPAIAQGEGTLNKTVITLPGPATGRYLLISQTGSTVDTPAPSWWSILELSVSCE